MSLTRSVKAPACRRPTAHCATRTLHGLVLSSPQRATTSGVRYGILARSAGMPVVTLRERKRETEGQLTPILSGGLCEQMHARVFVLRTRST